MFDLIFYFGPLELIAILLSLIAITSFLISLFQDRRSMRERQHLLDGFPYPAILFRKHRKPLSNGLRREWLQNRDIQALINDTQKSKRNILRTIPAVEGQTYQARTIWLSNG